MKEALYHLILTDLTSVIDIIGVVIIVIGVICSIARFFLGICGKAKPITIDTMRIELGRSIVLAVEFLLAADIIRTMVAPDYYSLGILGLLVVIRTVLTYFLDQELRSIIHQEG